MKYRLLGQHVTPEGIVLEEGTEVGDDTAWPWRYVHNNEPIPPSNQMEGLDDEGRKAVEDLHRKLYGDTAAIVQGPGDAVRKAREAEAKNQQKLDEGSKPVSQQQKYERRLADEDADWDDDRPNPPFVPPGPAAPAAPTRPAPAAAHRTGVTRPSPGPATPKVPQDEEDIRPGKPNEEQYPKG